MALGGGKGHLSTETKGTCGRARERLRRSASLLGHRQRRTSSSCPQGGSRTSSCSPGRRRSRQQGARRLRAGFHLVLTGDTALPTLPPLAHGLPNNLQGS